MSSVPNVGAFALDDDALDLLDAVDRVCEKYCTADVIAGVDHAGAAAFRRALARVGVLGLGTPEGGGSPVHAAAVAFRLGAAWAPMSTVSALAVVPHLDRALRGAVVNGDRALSLGSGRSFHQAADNALLVRLDPDRACVVAATSIVPGLGRLAAEWSQVTTDIAAVLPDRGAIVSALEVLWASYLAGACDRMIRVGADYAAMRMQFGRPIAVNQAISHPLAQCVNAAFAVEATARLAARRLAADPSRQPDTAAAYVAAVRLARRVCRVVPQVLGALGISVEGPVSAMLRRLPMAGVVPSVAEASAVVASAVLGRGRALPVALDLPADVERFRLEVAAFAAEHRDVHGYVRDERTRAAVKSVCRELGERGWLSLSWAPEHGGAGLSMLYEFVLWDELAYADVTRPPTGLGVVAKAIMQHGSEDQRREFLPRLRSGEIDIALGYSEPEAGSDLGSLRTRADPVEGGYIVNGEKRWTSNGHVADYLWLLCRTGTAESRTRGLTILLADMASEGITVRPIPMLDGARLNEIHFTGVFVPRSRRVGAENAAWTIISDSLAVERYVQMPPKRLAADLELLARRLAEQGRSGDDLVRAKMAELAVEVAEVATTTYAAVLAHEAGLPTTALTATHAKLLFSSASQHIADVMLELGDDRLPQADDLQAVWLQSLGETLGGGSTEILRTSLAGLELRLPAR